MAEATGVPREVILSGYYGFGNVGDDALLAALARAMLDAGVETTAVPAGDARALPHWPGLEALGRQDVGEIRRRLRRGAVLFSGGGGLLQNATSNRSLAYYLGLMALARLARRPYAIGFQSVGPLHGALARRATAWLACGAADVTVRDAGSRQTLVDLGVNAARVHLAADLAFLLPPPAQPAAQPAPDGPQLGLCLRRTRFTSQVLDAVAAWRPAGWRLVLVACQADDHELHRALAARWPDAATVLVGPGAVAQTQAALAACNCVVSERLHPLIFAAQAGVPAAGIVYDPKVAGLAADLDLPLAGSDESLSAAGLDAALATLLDRGEAERARLRAVAAAAGERVRAALAATLAALADCTTPSGPGEKVAGTG